MYVCLEYYTKFYIIHEFYVYVRISYNISYGIKYMITYHTFVWRSSYCICTSQSLNSFLQILPSCICFILKFCFNVFSKQTFVIVNLQSYIAHIIPWINMKFWWNMKSYVYYHLSNFQLIYFIKWEILLLPWNHLKLGLEHKMTYNSLSATPNSLRFWETH
jgi:hypothetical protein